MAGVGALGGFGGVEVDVDYVVEGADGGADGVAEFFEVDVVVGVEVGVDDDGA